jgi:hypothetical protein
LCHKGQCHWICESTSEFYRSTHHPQRWPICDPTLSFCVLFVWQILSLLTFHGINKSRKQICNIMYRSIYWINETLCFQTSYILNWNR